MCHDYLPRLIGLTDNLFYLYPGVGLPVADGALVLLLALEFKDEDLIAAAVSGNLTANTCRFHSVAEG
jgi:hypothetical protein